MTKHLTEEQRCLGKLYAWIHRRAEYLRAQEKTAVNSATLDGSESTAAKKEPNALTHQDNDTITKPHNQMEEGGARNGEPTSA